MSSKHCNYNEEQVRESGLLSPERMAAVEAEITARITPAFTSAGLEIKNARVADMGAEGLHLYPRVDEGNMFDYLRRSVLAVVLTDAELKLINDHCSSAREAALNKERFAKATKIDEEWKDGVFLGDDYFSDMESLLEHLESGDAEYPEYVWAAEPRVVIGRLDVSDVVENQITDRGWEDMSSDDLHGTDDLQKALDKFVEANASVVSYHPDYSKAILMRKPETA